MDEDFDEEDLDDILFVEFFAGDGVLSAAVSALGIPCDDPQDVATGGAGFGDLHEVEKIKQRLYGYYVAGYKLVVHFAPPCSTFPGQGIDLGRPDCGRRVDHKDS